MLRGILSLSLTFLDGLLFFNIITMALSVFISSITLPQTLNFLAEYHVDCFSGVRNVEDQSLSAFFMQEAAF